MNYNRNDVYYWFIIGMLGLTMYWVYIVIAPTFEIVTNTNALLNKMDTVLDQGIEQNNLTIEQNKKIIDSQQNSTATLKGILQQVEDNRQEQVVHLFTTLNQSNAIGNATADLILESISNVTGLIREAAMTAASEKSGETSGFLGGPVVITNETIPTNQSLNASNTTNDTS